MSALSNCVTCGIDSQALVRCSAVLRRMPVIGLRSTSPHLLKSGSAGAAAPGARRRRQRAAAEAAQDLLRERLHVVFGDAAVRAGARDLRDVDADLARDAAHRRRGRRGGRRRHRRRGRRCRRRRLALADVDDRRALARRRRPCAAASAAGALVFSASSCIVGRRASRRRPFPPRRPDGGRRRRRGFLGGRRPFVGSRFVGRRRAAVVDDQHDLTGLDLVAGLDLDFLDGAVDARRHFDGRLVGFELQHRLVLRRCGRPASPARAAHRRAARPRRDWEVEICHGRSRSGLSARQLRSTVYGCQLR